MTQSVSKDIQRNEEVRPDFLTQTKEGKKFLTGYAIKFGQRSKKLGNYYEIIDSRALDNVDLTDVKGLVDHDYSKVLGRTLSNTLILEVDEIGLKFEIELADTSYANDLYKSIERGDINECSFGFKIDETDRNSTTVDKLDSNTYLRTVKKIKELREISIVSLPAYENTNAEIKRDLEQAVKQYEIEKAAIELELLTL
ncbi:HK97 family phage prohead protease [Enterococcus casseliflavus]|uniref:HK97 family phage prohead protease n=1 Tax=Enterococcus TaxID=1350 RepID=UPI001CC03640|nr:MULTISPECIES: HK97 family phage prohead protease [Enterococcus]MBZ3642436.1 HK97 family phage prohead protease [Enterococcus casseliflavus]MCD5185868.1 HK97 family phage prohead protease [Enterococcus gallinarum]